MVLYGSQVFFPLKPNQNHSLNNDNSTFAICSFLILMSKSLLATDKPSQRTLAGFISSEANSAFRASLRSADTLRKIANCCGCKHTRTCTQTHKNSSCKSWFSHSVVGLVDSAVIKSWCKCSEWNSLWTHNLWCTLMWTETQSCQLVIGSHRIDVETICEHAVGVMGALSLKPTGVSVLQSHLLQSLYPLAEHASGPLEYGWFIYLR